MFTHPRKSLPKFRLCCSTAAIALCTVTLTTGMAYAQEEQPNFLVIVVDDMGMADLRSFGGEIPTPHLDALATSGMRLTNFHVAPTCSPTRAMLLTGVDAHLAGLGNMAEEISPNQEGQRGYEGYLNQHVVTVSSLLQEAGYQTYMTGKWHLGSAEGFTPDDRGFDRSFTMLSGGASHLADMRPAYHPDPNGKAPYMKDGVALTELPEDFEYSSQFYVDEMVRYIESGDSEKPFFAYLAFTAPHWPLQAPEETMEKYKGAYDRGYDVVFEERLEHQKKLGIISQNAKGAERTADGRPWVSLNDEEKRIEAKGMEIYAAMIDEIDKHTGRLIDVLEESGELENTMVIFMSDNGAEGHDLDQTWPQDLYPDIRANIDARHNFSYENMGKEASYTFYGPNWGRVGSPALRNGKGFTSEGGTRVAAFINHKNLPSGVISDTLFSVKDITPSILEMAHVKHPAPTYQDMEIEPMTGISMVSALKKPAHAPTEERTLVGELFGKISVLKGNWKLLKMPEPYGTGGWELYDLQKDLSERDNLSGSNPEKLRELERV